MGSERYQPNEALRRQRLLRGWSQQKVADLLETNEMMVGRWERGERKTSPFYQEKLCGIFGMTAEELGFMSEPQTTKKEEEVQTNAGREKGTEQSSFSLQKQSSEPSISIEEFLLQCTSSTKACWHLLREKGLATAGEILATMIPPLMKLIVQPSKYQQVAAYLATEAYLIRAIVAKHQLNFIMREVSCYEAVRCSRLANDPILHAAALMYLGYTHIFVPTPRPKQAVETFLEAVQVLGNAAPLLKSDICMGLADAYAQCKEVDSAHHYIQLAQDHFPSHPEYDPSYLYADCGLDTVYQWEAKTYLDLALYYPNQKYYLSAQEALRYSTNYDAISKRSKMETMIYQAQAAPGLRDLELFVTALRQSVLIARELGSRLRYRDAFKIYQCTPEKWQNEQKIKELAEEVFNPSARKEIE